MTSPSAWWGRFRRRWARLVPRDCAAYTALSTRPVVLFVQDFGVGRRLFALLGRLRAWPVHVVYHTSWHVDEAIVLPEHLARIEALVRAHPSLRGTALAETEAERARFAARGVDTVHCNQGAFVDERVFRPLVDVQRVHDAIHDARLDPFKRHRLAAAVERLALVTYRNDDTDRLYEARIAREFTHATWCNGPPAARRVLGAEEVNRAYAACRVGLCLSAREGSMWASAQYLLAGLPVVSTPSEGGRDELFDAAHVAIVAPEPAAIADAVRALVARDLDPSQIRRRTLERIAPHRARLFDRVQATLAAAGETRSFAEAWPAVLRHRMIDPTLAGRAQRAAMDWHDASILAAAAAGAPWPGR
ncbi:MAG: glycosyltransferase [Deltaproteobacteria bacterium]|nr:glycosyltransferase [Deltaproteobacteria bacterium]